MKVIRYILDRLTPIVTKHDHTVMLGNVRSLQPKPKLSDSVARQRSPMIQCQTQG